MIDIKEFAEAVLEDLKNICDEETFEVALNEVLKNNGVVQHGICIKNKAQNTPVPNIYLDDLYQRYLEGRISVSEASHEILRVYSQNQISVGNDFSSMITDWEWAKSRIVFRLVNAKKNEELLKEAPHRKCLDLSIIYTVYLEEQFQVPGSITIRKDLMQAWNITEKDLYKAAMKNTPWRKGTLVEPLENILKELMGVCLSEEEIESGPDITLITNSDRYFGSSVILYKGILESLAKEKDDDLWLLPSSVHEFLAIPAADITSRNELSDLVKSVNRTTVSDVDFLSDEVYYYDRSTKKLNIA